MAAADARLLKLLSSGKREALVGLLRDLIAAGDEAAAPEPAKKRKKPKPAKPPKARADKPAKKSDRAQEAEKGRLAAAGQIAAKTPATRWSNIRRMRRLPFRFSCMTIQMPRWNERVLGHHADKAVAPPDAVLADADAEAGAGGRKLRQVAVGAEGEGLAADRRC